MKSLQVEVENDHERIADFEEKIYQLTQRLNQEKHENVTSNDVDANSKLKKRQKFSGLSETKEKKYLGDITKSTCPDIEKQEPIDVVFTWVNGSDPKFQESLQNNNLGSKTHKDDTKPQRFEGRQCLLHKAPTLCSSNRLYSITWRYIQTSTN